MEFGYLTLEKATDALARLYGMDKSFEASINYLPRPDFNEYEHEPWAVCVKHRKMESECFRDKVRGAMGGE
jgi:hypothetical protein